MLQLKLTSVDASGGVVSFDSTGTDAVCAVVDEESAAICDITAR